MENPYTKDAMKARGHRHEILSRLYFAGSLGSLAIAGALFEAGSSGSANKLELLAGAVSALVGALSGRKALDESMLAGAEKGGALGMDLGAEIESQRMASPEYRQN